MQSLGKQNQSSKKEPDQRKTADKMQNHLDVCTDRAVLTCAVMI